MSENEKLWVMRCRSGSYWFGESSTAESFWLKEKDCWGYFEGASISCSEVSEYVVHPIAPHLKLPPGGGPIEVPPMPEVPSLEMLEALKAGRLVVDWERLTDEQCVALDAVIAFVKSFQPQGDDDAK